MNKTFVLLFLPFIGWNQSYAPAAGIEGSTAISKDSSIIINWASQCTVQRGYLDIANPGLGYASFGAAEEGTGIAEGNSVNVVSLGDSGVAILTFEYPIYNGLGPDFAIFENGFTNDYLELAFVEVSSDGLNYVRFPAYSETPTDAQIGPFEYSDCRYVHNLAGKYRQGFGTPFDLEDLIDSSGINISAITHIKIIDVIGTIDDNFASMDSQGNKINDLYPTDFESGGFDLDAVAVIHQNELNVNELALSRRYIYPNPASSHLQISGRHCETLEVINMQGQILRTLNYQPSIDCTSLESGSYFLRLKNGESYEQIRFTITR